MRVQWTRYHFERPEPPSENVFLLARLYPRVFLRERWREVRGDVLVNAARIILAIAIVRLGGWTFADDDLNKISPILLYPLVLGGFALLVSCSLSALSFLGFAVQATFYWSRFVLKAQRYDDIDDFHSALTTNGTASPHATDSGRSLTRDARYPSPERHGKGSLAAIILLLLGAVLLGRFAVSGSMARSSSVTPAPSLTVASATRQRAIRDSVPVVLYGILGDSNSARRRIKRISSGEKIWGARRLKTEPSRSGAGTSVRGLSAAQ